MSVERLQGGGQSIASWQKISLVCATLWLILLLLIRVLVIGILSRPFSVSILGAVKPSRKATDQAYCLLAKAALNPNEQRNLANKESLVLCSNESSTRGQGSRFDDLKRQ